MGGKSSEKILGAFTLKYIARRMFSYNSKIIENLHKPDQTKILD